MRARAFASFSLLIPGGARVHAAQGQGKAQFGQTREKENGRLCTWPRKKYLRRRRRKKRRAGKLPPGSIWRRRRPRRKENLSRKRVQERRREFAERARLWTAWCLNRGGLARGGPGSPVICRDCPGPSVPIRKA